MARSPIPRSRRTTDQVRQAMLAAARDVFSENGYAAARTKAIAEAAGASEQLIFAHFGSKRLLFEEAVLSPFKDFLVDYVDRFPDTHGKAFGPGEELSAFLTGYLKMLLANRRLLIAYVSASAFHSEEFGALEPDVGLEKGIQRLQELAERIGREQGFELADAALHNRIILATVLGLATFNELLFAGSPVEEETLAAAASELFLSGFMNKEGT